MDSKDVVNKVMTMLTEVSKAVAILAISQRIVEAENDTTEKAVLAQCLARLLETQQAIPNGFGQRYGDPYQEQYQSDMFNHQQ